MARTAAIGLIDHHTILHLDRLPGPDGTASVSRSTTGPGGSTANTAVALARLGEAVTLRAVVGADAAGDQVIEQLDALGIGCDAVTRSDEPTARTTTLLDTSTGERATLRQDGAVIRMGDRIDIAHIFNHDVVMLDMNDAPLRRFLTDLPAHTRPDVRLLGPLSHLVDDAGPDAWEIAFRFDAIVGTEQEYQALAGADRARDLVGVIQRRMPGANLRTAILTAGGQGSSWIIGDDAGTVPGFGIDTVDTIGASDAFVAGVAWGMARRRPWPETVRFASAVAALSTRSFGALEALPTLEEVERLLSNSARSLPLSLEP